MIGFNVGYSYSFSVMGRVWLSSVVRATTYLFIPLLIGIYNECELNIVG